MGRLIRTDGETDVAERFAEAAHGHVDRVAARLAGLERQARASAVKATTGAERAREQWHRQASYAIDRAGHAVDRAGGLLRDRPVMSAAIAIALGAIVLAALQRHGDR
jgi:ElaB/YqjD/DUF883 family membrane-anchored ribosome-binding protein